MMKKKLVFVLVVIILVSVIYFVYSDINFKNENYLYQKSIELKNKEISSYFDSSRWLDFNERLRVLSDNYKAKVGIYIKDLKTGKTWEYNADRLFRSASLIKLPIMVGVFNLVKENKISLETELILTSKERVDGSGSLKWARDGTRITVLELVYRMVTESDNTATRMLVDHIGIEYFKSYFKQIGLSYTNITEEGMNLTSGRVSKENFTTPREMGYLLERIYKKDIVSKDMCEMMLDILKRNKSHSRIRKGIPTTWQVGHKTGLLRKSCSDVGIVFSPNGDYILCVLLDDVPSYRSGKEFIAKVAKITAEFYKI
jgi:beta-lactamase class A